MVKKILLWTVGAALVVGAVAGLHAYVIIKRKKKNAVPSCPLDCGATLVRMTHLTLPNKGTSSTGDVAGDTMGVRLQASSGRFVSTDAQGRLTLTDAPNALDQRWVFEQSSRKPNKVQIRSLATGMYLRADKTAATPAAATAAKGDCYEAYDAVCLSTEGPAGATVRTVAFYSHHCRWLGAKADGSGLDTTVESLEPSQSCVFTIVQ